MKKLILWLTIIFFIAMACSKSEQTTDADNEKQKGEEENISLTLKTINVTIDIPENSEIREPDLKISSLFTENINLQSGNAEVEIFSENGFELVLATNQNDQITLIGYVNPSKTSEIELNVESTAVAMILLNPWTANLSVKAKEEAVDYIIQSPGFTDYLSKVEENIIEGSLSFDEGSELLEFIEKFQIDLLNKYEIKKSPLLLSAEGALELSNESSSMGYGIRIYDKDNNPYGDAVFLEGINKEFLTFNNVLNILSDNNPKIFSPTTLNINLPNSNGIWNLVAKSGLSFDNTEENTKAALLNSVNLLASFIGIISSNAGRLFKLTACASSISSALISKVTSLANLVVKNEMRQEIFIQEIWSLIIQFKTDIFKALKDCGGINIAEGTFTKLAKSISIVSNLENGVKLFFNVTDWLGYNHEIEFCFEVIDNSAFECSGTLFSDVQVLKKILKINSLDTSDPRWDSKNNIELIQLLAEKGYAAALNPNDINDTNLDNFRLVYLGLIDMGITTLPTEIGQLDKCEKIFLNNNQISTLPKEIGGLVSVKELYLDNNKIKSLPKEIGNLKNLLYFLINNNELTDLPLEFSNIEGNLWVDFDYNKFTTIPPHLEALKNIQFLSFNNNLLEEVPKEIGNLKSLTKLQLANNDNLKCLPQEVWGLEDEDTDITFYGINLRTFGDIDCEN